MTDERPKDIAEYRGNCRLGQAPVCECSARSDNECSCSAPPQGEAGAAAAPVLRDYNLAEYSLQVPRLEALGINTKSQFFEQSVTSVIALAEFFGDELRAKEQENARLRARLAEEEATTADQAKQMTGLLEYVRKMQEQGEGDGGASALQSLAAYFHESGNRPAYLNIRAAGHNAGFCIDNGGADAIAPTTGCCPLCGYESPAAPEIADFAPAPTEAQRGGSHG